MKLKRVQHLPSIKLGGAIPGDLHETLTAYAGYYREVHGEVIKPWSLVTQILRTFVDEDRAFQTWRRRSNGVAIDIQAGPRNGTRTESGNARK